MSSLASSLKQLGEIQVNDWDFMSLLNKDIKEIELAHSLRLLGNTRVMDWDFRTVLPAVNKLAHQEIDVVGLFKRAAHYKVMEWDFRTTLLGGDEVLLEKTADPEPSHAEIQELLLRMKNFLEYVVVNLIDEPRHAWIRIEEIESNVFRFKVVLVKRDVAMLIGREGHTVSAIRSVLKAAAGKQGLHVLLQICSHDADLGVE